MTLGNSYGATVLLQKLQEACNPVVIMLTIQLHVNTKYQHLSPLHKQEPKVSVPPNKLL